MHMYTKKVKSALIILTFLITPFLIYEQNIQMASNEVHSPIQKSYTKESTYRNYNKWKPIDKKLIENPPTKELSTPERFIASGVTWTKDPGGWWDTEWEYRINVTITEPNVVDRTDWPVDVYVKFDPPAFKYSIRVVRVESTGYVEVPSQVWAVTYHNDTHLSAAKVTFLVTIPKGGIKKYQIYWSTDYVDPPVYSKRVSIDTILTPEGDMYVVRSETKGWQIKLPPRNGGKASNMTLPTGYEIGHDWLHFGTTRGFSLAYGGYWGVGNTNNMRYSSRYILEETDNLLKHYEGVIFITYCVEDIPLYDENLQEDVAQVSIKYRIFDWGIIAEEKVEWLIDDSDVDYCIAGWVFDQDNGALSSTFNAIANDTAIIFNKTYPVVTYVGDISGSNNDRSFINALGIPLLSVYFVYLSAGSHSVYLDYLVYEGDDSYIYVFDTSGSLIYRDYDYNYDVTYTFSVTTSDWYYIIIGCYGDDNGDGYLQYNIAIDGQSVASDVRVGDFDRTDGYTVASDSIRPYYLNVTEDQVNIPHNTTLEWGDDSNLDLILYGPPTYNPSTGHMIAYSTQTTSRAEYIEWTPDTVNYYPVIVYRRAAVASTSSFTLEDVILTGFEFFDYYNFKSLDHVALFNNETLNGVGYVILNEKLMAGSLTYTESGLMWYNEGNDSEEDYIIVAKWFKGLTVTATSIFYMNYSVFPWDPQGNTLSQMYTVFANIKNSLKSPLTCFLAPTEKFLIRVEINVVDEDLKPIQGATVELINVTSGSVAYSGITDTSGVATFEVIRYQYSFRVSLTSGGRTYINDSVTKDFSIYDYTIHSDTLSIKLEDLIRFKLKALTDSTPRQIIQGGWVVLADPTKPGIKSEAHTNLTGWIDIYIKKGSWELAFNASTQTPERWDNITVFSDESLTTKVAGPQVNVTLTLSSGVTYWLVDHDITEAPVPTKLTLYNTLTFYEVYWTESITIYVNLTRTDTGENIAGNLYWYVLDTSGQSVINGMGTEIDTGSFKCTIDTTSLTAGKGYTILVNATPNSPLSDGKTPLKPSPVTIGLTVKERPLTLDVTFEPATVIYWNESLKITVYLTDSLSSTSVSGAAVKIYIYTPIETIERQLDDQGNGYYTITLKDELINVDVGSYTVIVKATKINYETAEKSFTLSIEERPTDVIYDKYIEIPWETSYDIEIQYIDERYNVPIKGAKVTYVLKEAATGSTVTSGSLSFSSGSYKSTLDLTSITESTYLIEIFAGKKNFENITITITFVVRLHDTTAQADTTKISVYYDRNITIRITYYDEDYNEYIAGAATSCTISGVGEGMPTITATLIDLGNGTYLLDKPASDLGLIGSYTITIIITKQHYERQTIYAALIVEPIPTIALASKMTERIEWGLGTQINVTYSDARTGNKIDADIANYMIANETWNETYDLVRIDVGTYRLDIDTIAMHIAPGVYTITVNLQKAHHENKTIIITLTVTKVDTYAYAQPANITLYWGQKANVIVFYNRTRDKVFIKTTPSYNVTDFKTGVLIEEGVNITLSGNRYVVYIDASKLTEGRMYVITILLEKTYYREATVTIYVTVEPIPVSAVASPRIADITWGDDFNFTVTILNALNSSGIEGVSIRLIILVGGEDVTEKVGEAIKVIEIGEGVYIIVIKSGLLNTTAYNIYLILNKQHFAMPALNVTARINPVSVVVSIRTTKSVNMNPVTGSATTMVEVVLRESGTGAPITRATVKVLVMHGEVVVKECTAEELEEDPGVYVAYIDWTGLEPGDYTIRVKVEQIQRKGYVASAEITMTITEGVTETLVKVDYLGGSTVIAGRRYPNLLVYPPLVAVLFLIGFIGYKYYAWYHLPIEVREIIQLLKKIQKGEYVYEAPTREEMFREIIAENIEFE